VRFGNHRPFTAVRMSRANLKLISCFKVVVSALSTPQADTVELTAKEARLRLAFKSQSQTQEHCSQSKTLSDKDRDSFLYPQLEQILLLGNHLSATINSVPYN
jgi:hypothetical protein